MNQRASYICLPTTGTAHYVLPMVGLTAFILAWFVLTDAKVINPNFLPSPDATVTAFLGLFTDAPARIADPTTGELRSIQPGWDFLRHTSGVSGTIATVERIASAVS